MLFAEKQFLKIFCFVFRIEYDAYRSDLEVILQSAANGQPSALAEAQKAHDEHKAEFEKLRADVSVKLKFLNENRVKVKTSTSTR